MDEVLRQFLNRSKTLNGTRGSPVERNDIFVCAVCGQTVDRRKLGDVLHHDEPWHAPIPPLVGEPPNTGQSAAVIPFKKPE